MLVVRGKLEFRQFRIIYKAIDVNLRKFIAIKILKQPLQKLKQKD